MNRRAKLILAVVGVGIIIGGVTLAPVAQAASIFTKAVRAFKKAGKAIKKGFKKVGKAIKKGFQRFGDCIKIVGSGSDWAFRQAGRHIALVSLKAAKKLQVLDPRLTALRAELATFETGKGVVTATKHVGLAGVEATRGLAIATGAVVGAVGQVVGKTFNITHMGFESNVGKLLQGELGKFWIKGIFFGAKKSINVSLNLRNLGDTIKRIWKAIF